MKTTYKIIAGLLIVAAAIVHLLNTGYRDWDSGGNTAYVLGLLFLFFWKERMEDERVRELKLKALTVAFAIGYAVTFGSKLALSFKGKGDIPRSLSAYDLMFVMLVAAHALFYYWRWQDGRTIKSESATGD